MSALIDHRARAVRVALLALCPPLAASLAGQAHAQTPPPNRGQVLQFDRPTVVPQFGDVHCTVPRLKAPDLPPGSGTVLRGFEVAGVTRLSPARIGREWTGLVGKPIDAATLDALAARVACVYREEGFAFAEAKVEETATPGIWRLVVREGTLAAIEVETTDPKARAFMLRAFGALKIGEPLRLGDMRRSLALANSYSFWGVEPMARKAPEGSAGDLVLVLRVPPPRPTVYASLQNQTASTVGTWAAGASFSFHGLTPLDEQTTLGLYHGLAGARQQGVQLSNDALLTKDGLGLHTDLSWFQERPHETPPNQDTVGTTKLARIELNHPLFTHADTLAQGKIDFEAIDQDVALNGGVSGGLATERDRLRVLSLGLRIDSRAGPWSGYSAVAVRKGLDGMGASRPGDPLLSRPQADPQAVNWRFDGRAVRMVGAGSIEVRARGQWADKPLLAFEEFNWGGLEGGRGLDPGAVQGDRGLAVTVQADAPPVKLSPKWTATPYLFADSAWTRNLDTYGDPRPASGRAVFGGAGLRLSWMQKVNLDLGYAAPLIHTVGAPPELAGPKLLMTISAGFEF